MNEAAERSAAAYIDKIVREARAQERANIVSDLIEWSTPVGESPEEDTLRLVIARIQRNDCQGHATCAAPTHVHGCFADKGDCDDPGDHEIRRQP